MVLFWENRSMTMAGSSTIHSIEVSNMNTLESLKDLQEDDTVICKNYGLQSKVLPYSEGYFIRWDTNDTGWPIVRFQCGAIELVDPADIK